MPQAVICFLQIEMEALQLLLRALPHDGISLESAERVGHQAELVLTTGAGSGRGKIVRGKAYHRLGDAAYWLYDAAPDHAQDQDRSQSPSNRHKANQHRGTLRLSNKQLKARSRAIQKDRLQVAEDR
ncbi:hypothetical protein N8D56_16510 [Devosia sp. A8/3-2]|nr:hypothetical protein N8D56_16510 [Devosia sp. A8/3-2]